MYILIDRGQMAITHKHSDRAVLAKLSWIECTNAGMTVALGNVRALGEFTTTELKLLYKNATGAELQGYANTLAHLVMACAKRMPETEATLAEVTAQAACINDGDKSSFRYVFGAMKPEHVNGLFQANPITVPRVEAEEIAAASAAPVPYHSAGVQGASGVSNATGTAREPRAPSAPSAPRVGGARDTIFRVADEMWAAKGKPTNIQEVLSLRKQIMVELEANYSVKKTTSSTALGDWQKSRLS